MKEKNEKMSMEKYLEFFSSHKQSDLKIEFLNRILSVHGFKKLKLPKSALADAVSTIDLMNPSRSTVKENIAPAAESMTLNGVMNDLNDLTWQECCVTSIKVLNSRQTESKENDDHKKNKKMKKKNNPTVASKVSKSSQDYVSVSASTTPLLDAGFEVDEIPKKQSIPKRKRSGPGGVNSSLP